MKCKRLLCFGMAAVMVFSGMLGMTASARELLAVEESVEAVGVAEGDFMYGERGDGTLEIRGYKGSDTKLVIPSEIGGKRVTGIGREAFSRCSSLTSVTIPKSVTSIGDMAFSYCASLTSITIPESVMSINGGAFVECRSLTDVTIPESVTSIGGSAFYWSGLTSITIPKRVSSIGDLAFNGCDGLTGIHVAEGNANYASQDGVLYNREKTELICCPDGINGSVNIPESVESISQSAFRPGGNGRLTGIYVAEGNANYASQDGVLYNREKTELIYCPNGINGSVSIPEGIMRIDDSAFSYCDGLTSVTIPGSVTSIEGVVFVGCNSLESIHVAEGNANYASQDGVLYNKEKTELKRCPSGKRGSISIPGGVTTIGGGAFYGCAGLTNVTIPGSVTLIGAAAFYGCAGLTNVTIPGSVTRIEAQAFDGCAGLKDIYYVGSGEQWNEIQISRYNDFLESANIYFDSTLPPDEPEKPDTNPGGNPQNPGNTNSDERPAQKKAQTIMANDIKKTYGVKPFSLGASALGGATLTYASSNEKVASVAPNGVVTVKGYGTVQITVTAAETKDYKAASKTVTLTVKPKKASLISVKSKKKKTALVKWKKDAKASGYMIECATDKKFKKNKVKMTVSKNKTVSATVKKLKAGKKYYVRACAFAKSGKTKIQGDWSKPKTVKVKK